jgi:hypothetical protein
VPCQITVCVPSVLCPWPDYDWFAFGNGSSDAVAFSPWQVAKLYDFVRFCPSEPLCPKEEVPLPPTTEPSVLARFSHAKCLAFFETFFSDMRIFHLSIETIRDCSTRQNPHQPRAVRECGDSECAEGLER